MWAITLQTSHFLKSNQTSIAARNNNILPPRKCTFPTSTVSFTVDSRSSRPTFCSQQPIKVISTIYVYTLSHMLALFFTVFKKKIIIFMN